MSDALNNDDIAQMIEDAPRFGYITKGVKYTTITTDALTLALRELLAARAERDAAVVEAVRSERERAAKVADKFAGDYYAAGPGLMNDVAANVAKVVAAAIRRGE